MEGLTRNIGAKGYLIEAAKTAENSGIFAQVYANGYDDTYMVVWAFDNYTTAATQWSFVHDIGIGFSKSCKKQSRCFCYQSWMNKTMPYEEIDDLVFRFRLNSS